MLALVFFLTFKHNSDILNNLGDYPFRSLLIMRHLNIKKFLISLVILENLFNVRSIHHFVIRRMQKIYEYFTSDALELQLF